MSTTSIQGKPITRAQALKGLGDPATWLAFKAKLDAEAAKPRPVEIVKVSPLAQHLTQSLFVSRHDKRGRPLPSRLTPDEIASTEKMIDILLEGHRWRQMEEERESAKHLPSFYENISVYNGKDRGEFFELQLAPAEPLNDMPYEVMINRYCVPGRYWTYAFQWHPSAGVGQGERLVYGSEGNTPIAPQLAQFAKDIEKPQVIDLFKQAIDTPRILLHYSRDLIRLLDALAPKSKVAKLVRKRTDDLFARRHAAMDAQRAARVSLVATGGRTEEEARAMAKAAHPMPVV